MNKVRKRWTKLAEKLLLGRKIIKIEWQTTDEANTYDWFNQAIKLYLDDGTIIMPQNDDEGNDAGVLLHINPNETQTSKYFPGEKFTKSDVLPVFRGE